jgi:MarR family transcriptional regulator, transcriptional regulator for hemolysin
MSPTKTLGWGLTALMRDYLKQVEAALSDLPGGSRGYMMLSAIADATCQSQVALAERLGLDRTTVTYLLDGLESEGLLTRTPDPADRRARHVNLTPQGDKLLARLLRDVEAAEGQVLARLSPDEAEHLRVILSKAAGLTEETRTAHVCQAAEENRAYLEGR